MQYQAKVNLLVILLKLVGIDKLNIKRSEIPAVTHVYYSARIQTVNKNTNMRYYDFISKDFVEKTLTTNMTTEGGGFKYTTKLDRQLTFENLENTLNTFI